MCTFNSGLVIGNGTVTVGTNTCSDTTGLGDCEPLTINSFYQDGGRMNYRENDSNQLPWWDNYLADGYANNANWPLKTGFGEGTNALYAAQAAARTNPSRPYVDTSTNILELGDLVYLIRDLGRNFLSRAGSANLTYQFGIAPLVGDLVKLFNFQDQLNRRVAEIERLSGPKGLRRTVTCANLSKVGTTQVSLQSNGTSLNSGLVPWTSTCMIKAHVRWRASADLKPLIAHAGMRAIARQAVLGLEVDASTAWELIPWSWLIDYGVNVGTYFKAHRNTIPAELLGVHIMKHTRTEYRNKSLPFMSNQLGVCSAWRMTRDQKLRTPTPVTLTAHFPFLSGKQVGILASLAVTRR